MFHYSPQLPCVTTQDRFFFFSFLLIGQKIPPSGSDIPEYMIPAATDESATVFWESQQGESFRTTLSSQVYDLSTPRLWDSGPIIIENGDWSTEIGSLQLSLTQTGIHHEQWRMVSLLLQLSEKSSVCISIGNQDLILAEGHDILPTWCHNETKIFGRLFIYRGSLCLIVPSELARIDAVEQGATFLLRSRDHRQFVHKALTRCIKSRLNQKEWESFTEHSAQVVCPEGFARVLHYYPQLVTLLVQYLPPDPDINKAVVKGEFSKLPFLSHSVCHESVSVALRFTHLQWAVVRSMDNCDVLPAFRNHLEANLPGRLLMSAMCCLLKRCPLAMIRSCLSPAYQDDWVLLKCEIDDVIQQILCASSSSGELNLIDHETDDSWLETLLSNTLNGDQGTGVEPQPDETDFDLFNSYFNDVDSADSHSSSSSASQSEHSDSESCDEETFMRDLDELLGATTTEGDGIPDLINSMQGETDTGPASALLACMLEEQNSFLGK